MTAHYQRIRHAAHNLNSCRPLWDLEEWLVRQAWGDPRPDGIPADTEAHRGYVDDDGSQIIVWQRKTSPGAGACRKCGDDHGHTAAELADLDRHLYLDDEGQPIRNVTGL